MLRGRFEEAWRLSDRVLAARPPDAFNKPWTPYHTRCVWQGRPPAGRVLIRCYHGLGDTLQFIRYARPLAEAGCTVLAEAQPELLALLRGMPGLAQAVPLGEGDSLPFDMDIESMELPHALRTRLATIPARVPYLAAPAALAAEDGRSLTVGLVWQGGDWDPRRSVAPDLLAPLFRLPGVRLVSLQLGAGDLPGPAEDLSTPDIAETARRLAGLDLLVTIDTMAAHLAGALARPVWTLLHADADWRWMAAGRRTPWYPTMRLYRQRECGDWSFPLARIAADLAALSHRRSTRRVVPAHTAVLPRRPRQGAAAMQGSNEPQVNGAMPWEPI